jgi:hypothetical protein
VGGLELCSCLLVSTLSQGELPEETARHRLVVLVPDPADDAQTLFEMPTCPLVIALFLMDERQTGECVCLPLFVSKLPVEFECRREVLASLLEVTQAVSHTAEVM